MQYVVDAQTGLIIRFGSAEQIAEEGERLVETDPLDDPRAVWFDGDVPQPLPPRPGNRAQFDPASGAWTWSAEDLAAELAEAIATGKSQINAIATRFETHFITPLPGQVEKYKRKELQGRAYLEAWYAAEQGTGPIPDDTDPRWSAVHAEVGPGLTGDTCFQVAMVYVSNADLWYQILDAYDPLRIRHVNLVESALTPAGVEQAVAAFQSELQQMADAFGVGPL